MDLDATLAHYEGWNNGVIGPPIPRMVERVKQWLAEGWDVRIFTARVCDGQPDDDIREWCKRHIGQELPVTCRKDFELVALYDDRAFRVAKNTGEILGA